MEDASPGLRTKSASTYEHLRRLTVRGVLRVGSRLSPTDLARTFQVSETPVRAALARLAVEGFIRGESNHGFFTKPWAVEEQRDLLGLLAVHYLSSLEGAGEEAWPIIMAELRALTEAAKAVDEGPASGAAFASRIERYFVDVALLAGNAAATEVVRNSCDRSHHLRALDMEDASVRLDMTAVLAEVAQAVIDGDLATARAVGSRRLAEIIGRLPQLVERANLAAQHLKFP